MKTFRFFYLISCVLALATPPVHGELPPLREVLHTGACLTGALSLIGYLKVLTHLRKGTAAKESYFSGLLLESQMDALERANLLGDIEKINRRQKKLHRKKNLLTAALALHLLYAGYYVGNKLFRQKAANY